MGGLDKHQATFTSPPPSSVMPTVLGALLFLAFPGLSDEHFVGPMDLDRGARSVMDTTEYQSGCISAVHYSPFFLCPTCSLTLTLNNRSSFLSGIFIIVTSGYSHVALSVSDCHSKPLQNTRYCVSYCHTWHAYAY